MIALALGAAAWLLVAPRPCAALPASAVQMLEGKTTTLPGGKGGARLAVSLRVRNDSDLALESLRVRVAFAAGPGEAVAEGEWRERVAFFGAPLAAGGEGTLSFEETGPRPHLRLEILEANPVLRITVDGVAVELTPAPYAWKGVVYGPAAKLARVLGCGVQWSETLQLATLTAPRHAVVVQAGSDQAVVDGQLIPLPGFARETKGVLITPVVAVMEALGAGATHDPVTNELAITRP